LAATVAQEAQEVVARPEATHGWPGPVVVVVEAPHQPVERTPGQRAASSGLREFPLSVESAASAAPTHRPPVVPRWWCRSVVSRWAQPGQVVAGHESPQGPQEPGRLVVDMAGVGAVVVQRSTPLPLVQEPVEMAEPAP